MSCRNRGPSGVTTAESDTETMDEGSISLTESAGTAEETTPNSPETETQEETKGEYTAEGIPSYYGADYLPLDMPFASQESLEILTDIYHEIGYFEEYEYESGDKTVYDYYRKKFALLLEGKVKMYDSKGNESLLYDRYTPMRGYEDSPGCEFYFLIWMATGFRNYVLRVFMESIYVNMMQTPAGTWNGGEGQTLAAGSWVLEN